MHLLPLVLLCLVVAAIVFGHYVSSIVIPAKNNDDRGGAGYASSCPSTLLKEHKETFRKNSESISYQ